jgi:hypothetical protein
MENMLRAFELEERYLDKHNPWGDFLQACAYGIRSNYHTTLHASPGQLVFGRGMIHYVPFQENWDRIESDKQKIIEKSNKRENLNRLKYKYKFGDRILLRNPGLQSNLLAPKEGMFTILEVIQHGIVQDRVNITHIKPFFE